MSSEAEVLQDVVVQVLNLDLPLEPVLDVLTREILYEEPGQTDDHRGRVTGIDVEGVCFL